MKVRFSLSIGLISASHGLSTCSSDAISCPSVGIDSCCIPNIGRIVLTQQWIDHGPSDAFTLHGLWPNYCNGSYPPSQGCDTRRTYLDILQLVNNDHDLFLQMHEFWPSYQGDNGKFWSHEWIKHGTCLSTAEPKCFSEFVAGEDALAYFRLALRARAKFDLYKALSAHGIVPGRAYTRDAIVGALSILGGNSSLFCREHHLVQIESVLYFQGSENLIMIDNNATGNCPTTVIYQRKFQNFINGYEAIRV